MVRDLLVVRTVLYQLVATFSTESVLLGSVLAARLHLNLSQLGLRCCDIPRQACLDAACLRHPLQRRYVRG